MPSDILAAFLYAQLEKMAEINKQRHKLFGYYLKNLTPLASENHLTLPSVPPESQTNTHLFYILLKNGKAKYELMILTLPPALYSYQRLLAQRRGDLVLSAGASFHLPQLLHQRSRSATGDPKSWPFSILYHFTPLLLEITFKKIGFGIMAIFHFVPLTTSLLSYWQKAGIQSWTISQNRRNK